MGYLRGVYGFLVLFLCFDEESLEEGVRWNRKKGFSEILVVVGGGGINVSSVMWCWVFVAGACGDELMIQSNLIKTFVTRPLALCSKALLWKRFYSLWATRGLDTLARRLYFS